MTRSCISTSLERLVGQVVKGARLESGRFRVRMPLAAGFFWGRVQWLHRQAPGARGSVLGLAGPVSVYCDWVGWKVESATSISVWQHVSLSEQIRRRDTLVCCDQQTTTTSLGKRRFSIHQAKPMRTRIANDLTQILGDSLIIAAWSGRLILWLTKSNQQATAHDVVVAGNKRIKLTLVSLRAHVLFFFFFFNPNGLVDTRGVKSLPSQTSRFRVDTLGAGCQET